jgi:Txe/YoeB family toxin of Txe-Axe toxin-antitoxin module
VKSHTTAAFRKLLHALPSRIRKDAHKAWRIWQSDPAAPGLQFKKLKLRGDYWSARVNDDHRVVGMMRGDGIVWFWIGSHDAYERLLKGL